jgi:hypothetical protein
MLRTGWSYQQLQSCPEEHFLLVAASVEAELKEAMRAAQRRSA